MENPADVKLEDIDQFELSLTGTPAVKEGFIMTKTDVKRKTDEERRTEFTKLDEDALFALFKAQKEKEEDEEEEDEEEDGKKKPKKGVPPEFNFDKTNDASQNALRTIGEAILGLTDVPEPVAEFAKSIQAKLPKPKNGDGMEAKIAFAKSAFPGLVEAIQTPLQTQLDAVKKTAEELQADSENAEMLEIAKGLPGDPAVTAKRLASFKKSLSEEDFEAYITEQKGLKEGISKSAIMERQSSGQPTAGSAEAIVLAKAQAIVQKGEYGIKTMTEAIEFVGKSDPVLWGQYQAEVRNRPAAVRTA